MTTRLSSLPDFRRLWFVGFASFLVRWLEMLAYGLFAYQITGSAFVVAMLSMLRLLPMGLFGAFLGAAADRCERRSALVLMVAVSMASTLALLLLASLDAIKVWHLAVASFVNGICWAADNPVRRTMIGDVVGHERMGSAMSFEVGTNNASRVIGPMLGGALLAQYGIASVFWPGVVLYAASLVAAVRINVRHGQTDARRASFIASVREGFTWLRGDQRLIGIFLITVIFNVFGWPFTSMIPVIGTDYLHLDPQGVGLLASCEGIGGLLGALLVAVFARSAWYGRVYVGAVAVYLAMVIGFATAPAAPMAAVFLLLLGVAAVGFAVMQATLVYRGSPVEMRARLLGVLTVCIGTGLIGFFYLGFLADVLTPRVGTVALAAQGMLALLITRRYWVAVIRP
jgi:predicted MFS family arabinose efflux permease